MNSNNISLYRQYSHIIGEALFFAVLQMSIATVELEDRSEVASNDNQQKLNISAESLRTYIYLAVLWTIASGLVLYGKFDIFGGIMAIIFNVLIIIWIYVTYTDAMEISSKKSNLIVPKIF